MKRPRIPKPDFDFKDQIDGICGKLGLLDPTDKFQMQATLGQRLGHLREKFNTKGDIDYRGEDLFFYFYRARFAIGAVHFYERKGIGFFHPRGSGSYFQWGDNEFMYLYFVDDAYGHLYSAWNSLANFLHIFFPNATKGMTYFHNVIDGMAKRISSPVPKAFSRLKKFRDGDYKALIAAKRNAVVHHTPTPGWLLREFIAAHQGKTTIAGINQQLEAFPGHLLIHYKRLAAGWEQMLEVIEHEFPPSKPKT